MRAIEAALNIAGRILLAENSKYCKSPHKRYLGEPVFVVKPNGEIVRTAIQEVLVGEYKFLKGSVQELHYFTFALAVRAAEARVRDLLTRDTITRKDEALFNEYLVRLRTKEFRESVFAQPLVEQQDGLVSFGKAQTLDANVEFPKGYIQPGQVVYCLVTPVAFNDNERWAPRPYFILVTSIKSVSFAPAHKDNLYYGLGYTRLHFWNNKEHFFTDLEEAKVAMVALFAKETGGSIELENIEVIPVKQEVEHRAKVQDALFRRHGLNLDKSAE